MAATNPNHRYRYRGNRLNCDGGNGMRELKHSFLFLIVGVLTFLAGAFMMKYATSTEVFSLALTGFFVGCGLAAYGFLGVIVE